ncbi:membrane protein [Arthrobacter phage Qui]|uniref:Membrane protein n=1 Tax=Arthrobacter phage Qui TaxID=2603260 RepID=A0A5B8WHM2_9CAUD|nr:membrane protein [Arthrobacter phage Qui]QED11509.1 membrane protein [Arthrobacter phage Qui]QOC56340.1 membrane protein [Arthrobacter phage Paella]
MSNEVEDFLAHYGVMGMKWGKRKARDTSDSELGSDTKVDPEEVKKRFGVTKKQAIIGASVILGGIAVGVILANKGNIKTAILEKNGAANSKLNKVEVLAKFKDAHGDSTDFSFPQGQVFSRMSRVAETTVREGSYAAHTPKDIANYTSTWWWHADRTQVRIEATETIKVPSMKKRLDTVKEMVDSPLSGSAYGGKTLREVLAQKETHLAAKAWVRSAPTEVIAEKAYNDMFQRGFTAHLGKEFLDKLRDQGYGAMRDDNDFLNKVSDSPMIFLNSDKFKVASSKVIGFDEASIAEELFDKLNKS